MSTVWNALLDAFESLLSVLQSGLEPLFGVQAWGWAIIAMTLIVRVALLPLAVKQTRSMRAMQELAPKIKSIQKKYPTDREMLRNDPEKYRARKAKVNEETMALYRDAGVNPAAGCLPLIAQMPIFFALFSVLRGSEEIRDEPFYFFTSGVEATGDAASGLGAVASSAGMPAVLLIVAMAATMFVSQRQVMSRNATPEGPAAQQQKIMLYVMPAVLAFFGFQLPLGVLLYWVTTNLWQMAQQYVIYRDVTGGSDEGTTRSPKGSTASSGTTPPKPAPKKRDTTSGSSKDGRSGAKNDGAANGRPDPRRNGSPGPTTGAKGSHLPGRRKRK